MRGIHSFVQIVLSLVPDKLLYFIHFEIDKKVRRHENRLLKSLGTNSSIATTAMIISPSEVSIGANCQINEFVHILGGGSVVIGDGVLIANHASIITATHPTDIEHISSHSTIGSAIIIQDDSWIGSHSVILPGVTLGKSCIVGAGSVVTKDVPSYAIVAGVPAKVIRYKNIKCLESNS